MERREFDSIRDEFFPGAVVSREEFRSGWMDTIEIGNILVEIASLHTSPKGSTKKKGVYAYIKARSDTHGKSLIWSVTEHPCDTTALRSVLESLKKNLLGMAAAITQMCGFIEDIELDNEFLDVDDIINERKRGAESEKELLETFMDDQASLLKKVRKVKHDEEKEEKEGNDLDFDLSW